MSSEIIYILNKEEIKMKVTQAEYTKDGGCTCPNPDCKLSDVEFTTKQAATDMGETWMQNTCNTCGATWDERYTLAGFENLEVLTPC